MFAVIKTGGKQYRVQEGDVLSIEKLGLDKGQKVNFGQVLLIDDNEKTLIGTPFLENSVVRGEVVENFKDKKIIVFKKKRRKQYKKKTGHRQELTRVKIEEIIPDLKTAPKKEPAKPVEKAKEKKAAPKPKLEREVKPKEVKEEKPKKIKKEETTEKEKKVKKQTRVSKATKPKNKALAKKKGATKTTPQAKKSTKMKEKEDGS